LEPTLRPILKQLNSIIKLNQADSIVGRQSRNESLGSAAKVVKIGSD
jgi:hypothetical protein